MTDIEKQLNQILAPLNIQIWFSKNAVEDLQSFDANLQEHILALILARAKKGPLFKPKGLAESLHGDLHGFAKIKPKHLGLRIIYRPVDSKEIGRMEIIAIGPRDKDEVYKIAAKRVIDFKSEMKQRVSK